MKSARVLPVVVSIVLSGGCGARSADDGSSHSGTAHGADTSDGADGTDTSADADPADLPLDDIEQQCRASQTREGCAAVRDELMQDYCTVDGVTSVCGCQWVVQKSLVSEEGDCFFSQTKSYCRSFAHPPNPTIGCLIGGPIGTCGVAFVGYQKSNEADVHAVGTIAEAGCFSPDAGTGTEYVSCFIETDSPTCKCLMAEAETICM